MVQLESCSLYLTSEGWSTPPPPGMELLGSLRINVQVTSDGLDIRSIEYTLRDLEGNAVGNLGSELLSQIAQQLEIENLQDDECENGAMDGDNGSLAFRLQQLISNFDREEAVSLLSPCKLLLGRNPYYSGKELQNQLAQLFVVEVAFYLVLLDLLYGGHTHLVPISFDMPYEGMDVRSLTRNTLHYMSIPFETVRLVGSRFSSECGWMLLTFFHGWGYCLVAGDILAVEGLILSVINSCIAATIERLGNERVNLRGAFQDRSSEIDLLISGQRKLQHQQQQLQLQVRNVMDRNAELEMKVARLELKCRSRTPPRYGDWSTVESETSTETEKEVRKCEKRNSTEGSATFSGSLVPASRMGSSGNEVGTRSCNSSSLGVELVKVEVASLISDGERSSSASRSTLQNVHSSGSTSSSSRSDTESLISPRSTLGGEDSLISLTSAPSSRHNARNKIHSTAAEVRRRKSPSSPSLSGFNFNLSLRTQELGHHSTENYTLDGGESGSLPSPTAVDNSSTGEGSDSTSPVGTAIHRQISTGYTLGGGGDGSPVLRRKQVTSVWCENLNNDSWASSIASESSTGGGVEQMQAPIITRRKDKRWKDGV